MLEALPENLQEQAVEHLRDYIADLHDELKWNKSFQNSQDKLVKMAKKARKEIAEGKSMLMDMEKL